MAAGKFDKVLTKLRSEQHGSRARKEYIKCFLFLNLKEKYHYWNLRVDVKIILTF
jgi:hypothetical protein